MPFDGMDFQERPEPPGRAAPGEKIVSMLLLILAISLLVMPISMAGLFDLVHYIASR